MVRLQDIADAAGVSVMTVSNVLNGRRNKVSPEKFEKIEQLITELGYVRSAAARSLSTNSSGIVTIVYAADTHPLDSTHDALLIGALEPRLTQAGKTVMIRSAYRPSDVAGALLSWHSDGAIFVGTFADEAHELRRAANIPMVFIDCPPRHGLDTVGIDDQQGGRLATRFLLKQGHTRIAFIGPPLKRDGVVRRRYEGFCQAFSDHNVPLSTHREHVITCETDYDQAIHTARNHLTSGAFTAVVATADSIAVGLMKGLDECGLQVPHDLSIVGFDDLPIARVMNPGLTTVRQDITAKADAAAQLLLDLEASGSDAQSDKTASDEGAHMTIGVSLVQRESVIPLTAP